MVKDNKDLPEIPAKLRSFGRNVIAETPKEIPPSAKDVMKGTVLDFTPKTILDNNTDVEEYNKNLKELAKKKQAIIDPNKNKLDPQKPKLDLLGKLAGVAKGIGNVAGGTLQTLANNREDLAKIAAGLAASGYNPGGQASPNEWLGQGYMLEADKLREERMAEEERKAKLLQSLALKQKPDDKSKDIQNLKDAVVGSADIKDKIAGVEDVLERINSGKLGGSWEIGRKLTMGNTDVKEYDTIKGLTLSNMARSLGGERGVLTDQDIKRIEGAWPKITDTKDERAVAIERIRQIIDEGVKNRATALGVSTADLGYEPASARYSGKETKSTVSRETPKQSKKSLESKYGL